MKPISTTLSPNTAEALKEFYAARRHMIKTLTALSASDIAIEDFNEEAVGTINALNTLRALHAGWGS